MIEVTEPGTKENRTDFRCATMQIACLIGAGSQHQRIEAVLDEGRATERRVTWEFAVDHPVFIFEGADG